MTSSLINPRARLAEGTEPRPKLVLLDLDLPELSRFELLEHIDHAGGSPDPIVVISDSLSDQDVADASLAKPTDYDAYTELVEAIERFWLREVRLPDESEGGCRSVRKRSLSLSAVTLQDWR